ncbi:sensor histidine kinase [Companilactobacillus jidongensis]|uniref:sensor histidine kinase n=1 Tax=Companilactobacillus jidongensis TaxID=2486006 RepID=UPI000F795D5F|nr:GHKL domain-containing protein [Companilactobacillus jidongensis]
MIYVETRAYLLGTLLSWIMVFAIFFSIYHDRKKLNFKTITATVVLLIADAIVDSLADDWSFLLFVVGIYLIFEHHVKPNYFLLDAALISSITIYLVDIVMSAIVMLFVQTQDTQGWNFTLISSAIEWALALGVIFLYRKYDLVGFLKRTAKTSVVTLLLTYFFVVLSIFMNFINHFQAYRKLIIGILLFIVIQIIVLLLIFLLETKHQKSLYQQQLSEEQFKNLKMYTDQLERDQLSVRKFKHDYENLLLSLRTVADSASDNALIESLNKFESYSDDYFNNASMKLYKDLNNVQNPYLKSLFISKLNQINHSHIDCHFECRNVINDISINIFDLVRLLGIAIDNAIEATKKQAKGKIQLAIISEDDQITFVIDNTVITPEKVASLSQTGYSTKKNHSGLGLSNVQDIKKKYPNLLVQYSEDADWFHLQLVLI